MPSMRDDMINDASGRDVRSHVLPDGRILDVGRARSCGPLDQMESSYCRAHGIALAFDPLQNGYVTLACDDDLSLTSVGNVASRASDAGASATTVPMEPARFTLRPWHPDEWADFLKLIGDPDIWRYLPDPYPARLDEELARNLIAISNEVGRHHVRAVVVDGAPIGQVRLLFDHGDPSASRAEISYWLGRQHWGRRLGSEVVAVFTRQCFVNFPQIASIVARVHHENRASVRILAKAGYRLMSHSEAGLPWSVFVAERLTIESQRAA